MKLFTLIAALLCAVMAGCSKEGSGFSNANTNVFYFGGSVEEWNWVTLSNRSLFIVDNRVTNICIYSNFTGTIRIGTNVIWPVKTP